MTRRATPGRGTFGRTMRTYRLARRPVRGSRVATCAEVACDAHVHGWRTALAATDPGTPMRVAYIENDSGRRYIRVDRDGWVIYTFPAGQSCFATHHADAELHHVVRDRRGGVLLDQFRHTRPDLWAEDFAENQQALADRQARG